ncbi:MAG: pyrophosphatase PpaX [Bacillota bacterium]|nr:pyrophosphatase PpaX [Bacillota bacterium]
MTYAGVLFDLDGTLLDTVELIVRSYQHTFRQCLGREVGEGEILANLGLTLSAHLALYHQDPAKVEEMVAVYRTFNLANHDRLARLFPGVRETLAALAGAGVRLAVVSSKGHWGVRRGLDLFDLSRFFQAVVTLEDTERHKPDPQPVEMAVERLGLLPGETLMVGDSPADLEAGRRAGTRTAAVAWSTFPPQALRAERPDHLLGRMADLLPLCGVG